MPLTRETNAEPIPGYRLIERIGSGGFGEVWKCEAPGGLVKAVKFVFGNLNALDIEEAFKAEQELNALQRVKAIRHPFILSMERVEIIGGELVIVMELADRSVHDRMLECRAAALPGVPRDELLHYLRDAAEALDLMNTQHDLQHLDIKPRNLFLVSNRVKVADFGLVKGLEGMTSLTPTSGPFGGVTPLYAAPETFQGIISRHSDQYSLAIVYQELLTGTWPFNGKTPRVLAMQHMKEEPDLRALPATDRPAVVKAMAKDPRQRFSSCMAFIRALITGQMPGPNHDGDDERVAVRLPLPGRQPLSMPETMEDLFLSSIDAAQALKREDDISLQPLSPDEAAQLSVTVAQPMTGSLKPTLVIGLGNFGRQALQALRCRFIDRFGSLGKIPLVRFLYLDTDVEALLQAQKGPPEQALTASELCHVPLQAIGHFRRNRQALEQITQWLPFEKLYALPRSLETQGTRALGRLAFADNYLRLTTRLKRELQLSTDPEHVYESVKRTGLALRSEIPQVYVLAAAGGGTGSGMLVDLGYTLRRLLHDLEHPSAEIVAMLMCGAPNDPAMPSQEQANLYATLTEINHFSDPAVPFVAQYGVDGPTLRDQGPPFHSTYLVKMPHRSPEGLQQGASRIASYVFHDLSTPLGIRLGQSRQAQFLAEVSPFRSFGTYVIWFPRGLMLRVAARRACHRMLHSWQAADPNLDAEGVRREAAAIFADPRWRPDNLMRQIDHAATTPEGTPGQALTAFLATLQEQANQAVAREDPAGWCRQALERIREWVGSGVSALEETSEWRRSRVHRMFATAVQRLADEYVELLARPVHNLFDQPGYRLAAADAYFANLLKQCEERAGQQEAAVKEMMRRTESSWQHVDLAVQACLAGIYTGFTLFPGNRTRKLLHGFLDRLVAYARQRLAEETARSVVHFYAALRGRLNDLRRDLSFCQQRLRHLEEHMLKPAEGEEDFGSSGFDIETNVPTGNATSSSRLLGDAATALASRVVLPDGAPDLDVAASHFLERLLPQQWAELERFVQEHTLAPLGGLYQVCITSSDLTRMLGPSLLEGAAEYLGQQLPVTDVSEAELSAAEALGIDLVAQAKAYHSLAAPSIRSEHADGEEGYLLVPNSEAGKQLGESCRQALEHLNVVRAAAQTDLLFCREQASLSLGELQRLLLPCKPAYLRTSPTPSTTPHVRCDILDWIPLDP